LGKLLALSRNQLEGIDIAVLNLACSKGLPGEMLIFQRLVNFSINGLSMCVLKPSVIITSSPIIPRNTPIQKVFFKAVMIGGRSKGGHGCSL